MAANLMDLVRELKALNSRKKAGEQLSAAEEVRRKELKEHLKQTLDANPGALPPAAAAPVARPAPAVTPAAPVPSAEATDSFAVPGPVPLGSSDDAALRTGPVPRTARSVDEPTGMVGIVVSPDGEIAFHRATPPAPEPPARLPSPPSTTPDAVPAPPPVVPTPSVFAVDTGSLFDDASSSSAVQKVDPLSLRKAHASSSELEESAAKAEAAVRALKRRPRARTAEEAAAQLKEVDSHYTPPADAYAQLQYYGDYEAEGLSPVEAKDAPELRPLDPTDVELARAGIGAPGQKAASVVPAGLAFLDDYLALYTRKILLPADEVVAEEPPPDPNVFIGTKRKVSVHLLNGEKRQGVVRTLRRGDAAIAFEPLGSNVTEQLPLVQCKALFVHQQPNARPRPAAGAFLTVVFHDNRSVAGNSTDYAPGSPAFTLIPKEGTGFESIVVNGAAVARVQ